MIRGCTQTGPPIGPAPQHTHKACCSECADRRLGDTPDAAPDPAMGVFYSLLFMVGGFVLAGAASGKLKLKGTR